MIIKILKWGNSLWLRIPKSFAKKVGVKESSAVDISLEGDHLVICPVRRAQLKLFDMLSQVRVDNIHSTIHSNRTCRHLFDKQSY